MSVNQQNYRHHGKGNKAIVLECPKLVGNHLVHFDHNPQSGSWVIRDFVTGQQLSNNTSQLTVSDIEDDAQNDEVAPFYPVTNNADWTVYLRLRTMIIVEQRSAQAVATPNPSSGTWRTL